MIIYLNGPAHIESLGSKVMPGAALSSLVWPSAATGHNFLLPLPGTPWQHLFDPAFVGPLVVVLAWRRFSLLDDIGSFSSCGLRPYGQ